MFYVCAANQSGGVQSANSPFKAGPGYTGIGAIAGSASDEAPGTFTAIDAQTGKVVWQKTWPEPCYSGTVDDGGQPRLRRPQRRRAAGLRRHDRQAALELPDRRRRERRRRRSSSTTASSTSPSCAGGNSLTATPHGDSLWLFGLDGTIGPAKAPGAGRGHRARRRGQRRQTPPRRGRRGGRARPSSRTTAPSATASPARAATAVPT